MEGILQGGGGAKAKQLTVTTVQRFNPNGSVLEWYIDIPALGFVPSGMTIVPGRILTESGSGAYMAAYDFIRKVFITSLHKEAKRLGGYYSGNLNPEQLATIGCSVRYESLFTGNYKENCPIYIFAWGA